MSSTLCLTCASTITQKSLEAGDVHQTKCCERYICAPCQSRNPRLRAYDPCLACLGGVSATSSSSKTSGMAASGPPKQLAVRGGASDGDITVKTGLEVNDVLENDMFTIGDDEDDGEEEQSPSRLDCEAEKDLPPPPPYSTEDSNTTTYEPPLASEAISSAPSSSAVPATISSSPSSSPSLSTAGQEASLQTTASSSDPRKYYIEPGDTLSGISLKLGVDGRRLARLNNLPPSTLTTTPHLLHTRRFLNLPQGTHLNARMISSSINQNNANASQSITTPANNTEEHVKRAREHERAQERATKRFAFVTKEVDYRVARAYVALAEEFSDSSDDDGSGEKAKKARGPAGDVDSALTRNAEARAVDRYLEDEEWERNELRAGRPPKPPSFPWVKQRSSASSSSKKGS